MASIAYPAVEVPQAEVAAPQVPLLPDLPVAFVIPAFNEEENLPRLFADLERRPRLFPEKNLRSSIFHLDRLRQRALPLAPISPTSSA